MNERRRERTVSSLGDAVAQRAFRNLHPHSWAEPQATAAAHTEMPRPSGCFLADDLLGGMIPGTVTVVRAAWSEAALAAAAELTVAIAESPRRVLTTTSRGDARALLDVITARASNLTLDRARALDFGRDPRGYISAQLGAEALTVTIATAIERADDARLAIEPSERMPEVIVAMDADAGGSITGDAALPRWREVARELGIPVFIVITGTAAGWTDPDDAHIEIAHTHLGVDVAWFVARGVRPGGGEVRTMHLRLTRPTARLRRMPADPNERVPPPPRCIERSWNDDRLEPPVGLRTLTHIVCSSEWSAASPHEQHEVLVSLAMNAFEGELTPRRVFWAIAEDELERAVLACGGLDAWTRVLVEVGRDHGRVGWNRFEASHLPHPELPEDAPAAWRVARRLRVSMARIART